MKAKYLSAIMAAAILLFLSFPAMAVPTGEFYVTTPSGLDSTNILMNVFNRDTFDIQSIEFDLSGVPTTDGSTMVIDPPAFNFTNPAGGSATFYNTTSQLFGFNFTSFNTGDSFFFNWDPDSAIDASYGAVISELAGIKVNIGTSAGIVSGLMQITGEAVAVSIPSPVPEPTTMLLLGTGLLGLAAIRRIKK